MCPFPPLVKDWMDGKTQATVRFVTEAEHACAARSDISESEAYTLRAHVQMLKDGQTSLEEFETVDDWLERLRDHYP